MVPAVTSHQRGFSVQSSFKLKLSPHLVIKAANIRLIETVGQGDIIECVHVLYANITVLCI